MIDRDELAIELQALLAHLRSHQPDALVSSYLAHADAHQTVMQVTVTGSNDVQTGAHASAPAGEASAEIAENRAMLRVLIAMGIPPVEQPRLRSVPAADASRVVHFPRTEAEKVRVVSQRTYRGPHSGNGRANTVTGTRRPWRRNWVVR